MARKKYDCCIKTGTYTAQDGSEKGRYQNIGAVLVDENDRPFLVLEPWFSPSGAANDQGKVFVSLFEPKQRQQQAPQSESPAPSGGDDGSNIPFKSLNWRVY